MPNKKDRDPRKERESRRVTTQTLRAMKQEGVKISMLTAYDFTMAKVLDRAGMDVILVGDSAGTVFQGHETTIPVTVDQMAYHCQAVVRGIKRAMVVCDLPFMSFQINPEEALRNAGRLMKESGAHAVKLEGGATVCPAIEKIVSAGIPVMGHLGLTPQSIYKFGTYVVRARDEEEAEQLRRDAVLLERAGCFAIVLEKVPAALAAEVSKLVSIPTIGIGAGPHCDGQVLVTHDMLGLFTEFRPRFVRRYADLGEAMYAAFRKYIEDVRAGSFPSSEESY
ncbi:MAG: 3-methyl-2-oxobutanoate hydroxymethyltransferase [Planctomycetota bacterium]